MNCVRYFYTSASVTSGALRRHRHDCYFAVVRACQSSVIATGIGTRRCNGSTGIYAVEADTCYYLTLIGRHAKFYIQSASRLQSYITNNKYHIRRLFMFVTVIAVCTMQANIELLNFNNHRNSGNSVHPNRKHSHVYLQKM